ncbi:uncharacterized protein [Nicotiana tomentosiformis]|uniref:uncharacterized protein n=1 Tax=Nicotiana tomentosiformis TaxID=4098 RepID=UPI00388C6EE4
MGSLAYITVRKRSHVLNVQALSNYFVRLDVSEPSCVLACIVSQFSLCERIRERQYDNPHLLVLKDTVVPNRLLLEMMGMQGRLCLRNVNELRELILEEAHSSRYSIHPGATKMYQDMRQHHWWRKMKKDIVAYVARCLNCQQVKYKDQRPGVLLHRLEIPEWK